MYNVSLVLEVILVVNFLIVEVWILAIALLLIALKDALSQTAGLVIIHIYHSLILMKHQLVLLAVH